MAKLTSRVASLTGQAEAQRLYPALQQLLASWCSTCRTGDAASQSNTCSCTATTSLQETSTACSSSDADSPVPTQRLSHLAAAQGPVQPHLHHITAGMQRPWQYHSSSSRAGVVALNDRSNSSSSNDTSKQGGSSSSSRGHSSSSSGHRMQSDPLSEALMALHLSPKANQLTPSAIVQKLDKHIVGQPVSECLVHSAWPAVS